MDGTECTNHSGVTADAVCRVCGKPVCADCCLRLTPGTVCEDPEHKIVLEEWDTVFRSNSEFEADMIVRNLEYQGLKTKTFSSRRFKQTIGEDSRDCAQVFVHRSEYHRAQMVLSTLGLLNIEQRIQESNEGGSTVV